MDTIGLAHYQGQYVNGFGSEPASRIADLQKALEAGYQVSSQTGGSALRVESLEGSLKIVSHTANHIKFWKKIPKSPAYSTVEEYNQLTSYGAANAGAFVREGESPQVQDTSYARRTAFVKYVGVQKEVSHQMTVVHPAHGDVIAQENQAGILWLLERIESALFKGDSSLSFSNGGESEQWDGLDSLIDPTSVLDLEGQPLQEASIEEATDILVNNFAYPTDIWLSTRAQSDLVKTMYPRERVNLPAPQNGRIGMTVTTVDTQAGPIELNPDVFLKTLPVPPSSATSPNAPATPTSIVTAVNTGVTNGDFNKGAPAGTNYYSYVVTAANRFGESAPTAVQGAATAITQAEKDAFRRIDATVTNAATIGAFPPEYFKIYRTAVSTVNAVPADLASYSLIIQVAATSQTASATQVIQDVNYLLPFTSIAYIGEMTPSVLTFRQLLPLMRLDLAVLSPSYRWLIMMYGMPVLFAPAKFLRILNVGRLS